MTTEKDFLCAFLNKWFALEDSKWYTSKNASDFQMADSMRPSSYWLVSSIFKWSSVLRFPLSSILSWLITSLPICHFSRFHEVIFTLKSFSGLWKDWAEAFSMSCAHDRFISCLDILLLKNISFNRYSITQIVHHVNFTAANNELMSKVC